MTAPRVLLIGLGRWGEKHLRVLRELGVSLWVADVSAERLEWAIRQGVSRERACADVGAALEQVDAVDLVTPADSHLALGELALGAGRHCFIEKPLALTAAEARRLDERARARSRVLQVGHIFRFHPVTVALRDALGAGRIGRVRFATGRFSGFKRPRTDVGVAHTDAIHYFDLFAYLFEQPATAVAAVQRDYLGRGLDDLSFTTVHYGDIVTTVDANYFVPGTHRECVIVGEHGSLVADYGTGVVSLHTGEHHRRGEGWEAIDTGKEELSVARDEPLRVELDAWLAACAGLGPVPVTAADGVRAIDVVEAARESARLGRTVTVREGSGA